MCRRRLDLLRLAIIIAQLGGVWKVLARHRRGTLVLWMESRRDRGLSLSFYLLNFLRIRLHSPCVCSRDGNLPDIVTNGSLHEFLVNLHEKYGPIVSFWFGRRLVISLGTIDLLKEHINPNRTCEASIFRVMFAKISFLFQ